MPHDVIGGVSRMLFIGDFMHHKKLATLIVEAVVLAQSDIEFIRVAGENRLIGKPRDPRFDRRAQVSVAQHDAHVHEIFERRPRHLEIFFLEAHGKPETLDQVRMVLLLGEFLGEGVIKLRIVRVLEHANHLSLGDGDIVEIMLQGPGLNPARRELAGSKLGEIARLHQSLDARLDDVAHQLIDQICFFSFHKREVSFRPCDPSCAVIALPLPLDNSRERLAPACC